jgi:hypothetical protein
MADSLAHGNVKAMYAALARQPMKVEDIRRKYEDSIFHV